MSTPPSQPTPAEADAAKVRELIAALAPVPKFNIPKAEHRLYQAHSVYVQEMKQLAQDIERGIVR